MHFLSSASYTRVEEEEKKRIRVGTGAHCLFFFHLGLIFADPVYIVLVPDVPLLLGQDDEAARHPGSQAPGLWNNDMM